VGDEQGPLHDADPAPEPSRRDGAESAALGAGASPAPAVGDGIHDLLRGAGIRRLARTGQGDETQARLLLRLQGAAGNAAVGRLLRQVAPPTAASEPRPGRLIVDDQPAAGQIRKDEFMDLVNGAVLAVAEEELSDTIFSPKGCPWVEHWVSYYRERSASEVEQALMSYAPEARSAATPQEAVQAVAEHVRAGFVQWLQTGGLPAEAAAAVSAPAPVPPSSPVGPTAPSETRRSRGPLARVAARSADLTTTAGASSGLGPGRPLGGAERRVASAFAADVGDVRIHDDAAGADVATAAGAHAVAVGSHIAFADNRYMPGTMVGDALLAHELAHVVQQRSGWSLEGDLADLERDADVTAAGALARVIAGPGVAAVHPGRRSRLALQRCGDNVFIPPQPAQRSYDEVIAGLRRVADHKRAVAAGQAVEDPDLLATESTLMDELRRMGVRLEAVEVMNRLLADPTVDLRRVRGRMVQIPGGEVHWGEKYSLQAQLDYVPPGRNVEYEWRWKAGHNEDEFQFGQAPNRSSHDKINISEGFWLTERDGRVGASRKLEVTAKVYLGKETVEQTTLSTGEISIAEERVPNPLTLAADPTVPIVGGRVNFTVADWAPEWTRHELTWEVDGNTLASDTVGFQHAFATPGRHNVALHVNSVRRSFGIRERHHLTDGSLDLTVQDVTQASQEMLDVMRPGTAMLPGTRALEQSLVTSIAEIERHAAEGGEQRDYWIERLKVQRKRLATLREHAYDLGRSEDMPADPAALTSGHAYNGPIPAVLSMPSGAGVQPLTIHVSVHQEGGQWVSRLIDVTSKDVFDREGRGGTPLEAHRAAFRAWINDHPYPRGGTVTYRFPAAGWDVPTTFKTKDTAWDTAVAWLDGIVTVGGYIAAGLLLMAPEATVTKWLGYTILTLSVARSGIAIYENLNSGIELTDPRNVLEGISILTSFLGVGGSALRSAGIRTINPAMFRAGNWVIMTGLATDAATVVVVAAEGLDELRAVQADPTLDEGQKGAAIVRLIGTLGLRTLLFVQSNKQLFKNGISASDFVYRDPRMSARVGPAGEIQLSQGSRLDLAVEFRRAGDAFGAEVVSRGRIADREILDRHTMLGWLRTLPPADATSLSSRVSTATMARLQGISAGEALAALNHVNDDALFNRLVGVYGAARTQAMAPGVGRIVTSLAGDRAQIGLIGDIAALEQTGKVVGLEQWVGQTAPRGVNPASPPAARAEQAADVRRLTGELSALKAVAAQEAANPNTIVRFNPSPPRVAGQPTPASFDIHVEPRVAAGAGGAAAPTRMIEVETVEGAIGGSRDLHGAISHAGTKLPLEFRRGGAVPPPRPGAALPTASVEAGVVVPQWPLPTYPPAATGAPRPAGRTTTFAGDGSYVQDFGGGRTRTGSVITDLLADMNGRPRPDGTRGPSPTDASGAPYLDRINIIDGSTGRVVATIVNDPAPGGVRAPRHSWRRP
jgi:hypothetical protein